MSGNSKLVYSDSGIFIAYMANENRPKIEMDGIQEQVEAFLRNDLFLCTSTITIIEVLRSKLYPSAYNTFLKFTKRKGVDIASVTRDVAIIAHEIRDYYSKVSDEINVSITTPDAIMG